APRLREQLSEVARRRRCAARHAFLRILHPGIVAERTDSAQGIESRRSRPRRDRWVSGPSTIVGERREKRRQIVRADVPERDRRTEAILLFVIVERGLDDAQQRELKAREAPEHRLDDDAPRLEDRTRRPLRRHTSRSAVDVNRPLARWHTTFVQDDRVA